MTSTIRELLGLCVRRPLWTLALLQCLLVGMAAARLAPGYDSATQLILDNGWDDGRTFHDIAFKGYRSLPLYEYRELAGYPLSIRAASLVIGRSPYCLSAVSALCAFLCCVVLFHILRAWGCPAGKALGGAVFFAVFRTPETVRATIAGPLPPMEHLVAIEGSEPLFLLLCLLSFLLMQRERHLPAALWLCLATLVRIHGAFVACGAFAYLLARRDKKALLYTLCFMVLLAHFSFYYVISGDFFAFSVAARCYYSEGVFGIPFHDLVRGAIQIHRDGLIPQDYAFRLVFQAFFIVGFILLFRQNRLLFCLMLPLYLVNICMKEWSHHVRYYVVLWGVNMAYYRALLQLGARFAKRATRETDASKAQAGAAAAF